MGSINDEEKLVQMVRDFIELGSITPINPTEPPDDSLLHDQPQPSLQEILSEATDFETQIAEKVFMYIRNMEEQPQKSLKKWVVKRLQMDGFEASLCKTSWVSTFGLKPVFQFVGNYEYIDVMMMMMEKPAKTRVIVDMEFRAQFEVARPTPKFKGIVESLPCVFVGTEERLNSVICVVCSALKESFKEKCFHIPPWRKASYMKAKWLSKNCKKVSVLLENDREEEENGNNKVLQRNI